MDLTIDELISHPSISSEPFNIRTASGDKESISLTGLPTKSTYRKTYHTLKVFLELQGTKVKYDSPFEASVEHRNKLESVLAHLSDAQFQALVKILACSPAPRHRMYLGICAMLPGDLDALLESEADRLGWLSTDPAVQKPSPPANHLLHPQIPCELAYDPEAVRIHNQSRNAVLLEFGIGDVDGARDLLLKIILYLKDAGSGMNPLNVEVLQRFASLSELVSRKLIVTWMGKWPLTFGSTDAFTLELRRAYGPDGVFLPTMEMLKEVGQYRDATPAYFKVNIPTEESAEALYEAFGLDCNLADYSGSIIASL